MQPVDHPRQRRILSILIVSAILIWIDSTVLGIALERLADPVAGLGATPGQLQWALGIYSLFFATALFAAGALGDRYGHRTVLMLGMTVFGASSAWAAWSDGPVSLILARALMGVGGAMIMPTSMAIIGSTFSPERRAGAIAAWSASAGVGVATGPVLGGLLIDHFWWGSVFLINLPLVAAGLIGTALVVPNPRSPERRRLDPLGLGLSTFGLLGVAYGLIEGGQQAGWGRWQVWGSIAAGVLLIAAFLYSEWKEREPSFDPRLFRNRRFAAGNFALAALFLTVTGQSFYITFYLQGARDLSALDAGLLSLPGAAGVVIGAPLGARLARRFGVAAVAGTALAAFALCHALNLTFAVDSSLIWFCLVGGIAGIAIGTAVAPTTAAVLSALPMDRMGAGSAVNNAIRQVGSVLGVALLGTVLANAYQHKITPALDDLPAGVREAASGSAEATRRTAAALGRPDLVQSANDAFIQSMHIAAGVAAVCALLGAVVLAGAFRTSRAETEAAADQFQGLGAGGGTTGGRSSQ
ncbi:MFS transporter [Kribbella sancticallisti]|uniref:MFS transporter n=1 Tax=Kribbella sancticallisti TaxID=460087 RepID=A0ABN2C828_9ACTN